MDCDHSDFPTKFKMAFYDAASNFAETAKTNVIVDTRVFYLCFDELYRERT